MVCSGAKPLAITNCLNFGSPTKPEIFWQFKRCVEGMAEACRILGTPVTGGNVSFYNENPKGAIDPTPVVGMLGLLEDVDRYCSPDFKREGDLVILLGECKDDLGGSEYLKLIFGLKMGDSPQIDLEREKAVQRTCFEAIKAGLINSAHDCSEGGLAVTLAECCILNSHQKIGAIIDLLPSHFPFSLRTDSLFFGETQSRIVVSCRPEDFNQIRDLAHKNKAPLAKLGKIEGDKLIIGMNGKKIIDIGLDELEKLWRKGLSRHM